MENQLDQWNEAKAPEVPAITVEQMDALLAQYREARDQYGEAKKISTDLYKKVEEYEAKVLGALDTLKRDKYSSNAGNVYITEKDVFKVPPSVDAKKSLFDYIKGKYGPETLMAMVSINYQTLNSWAKGESDAGVMAIPGLEQPTTTRTINFRRS